MTGMHWRVDTPRLIKEMVEGNPSGGILTQPANIFIGILEQVALRAIALDDAELNILMLRLNLYDINAADITCEIEKQRKRLK